jgi:hypothetical protein
MYGFLGSLHSRAETVDFRRGALPPYATLLHGLRRYRLTAQAWHPWMLRVLDVEQALLLRGWPSDLSFTTAIGIGGTHDAYRLRVADGAAEVEKVDVGRSGDRRQALGVESVVDAFAHHRVQVETVQLAEIKPPDL